MLEADDAQAKVLQNSLVRTVEPLRQALTSHELYERLDVLSRVCVFMESHVFAVWDFMTLVKTLQQRLTCVSTPWQPPPDPLSARLINEIVLGEESDECGDGRYASHFELYLEAMAEVGANTAPIRRFLNGLTDGRPVALAIAGSEVPTSTKAFVINTLATAEGATHEVAASFLLGREDVIPEMFERMLGAIDGIPAPTLRWYLQRHIEVDGGEHGPMGFRLLRRLCGNDPERWNEAERSARRALTARRALWDGVCGAMDVSVTVPSTAPAFLPADDRMTG